MTPLEQFDGAEANVHAAHAALANIETRRAEHAMKVAGAAVKVAETLDALGRVQVAESLGETTGETVKAARNRHTAAVSEHAQLAAANGEFDRRAREAAAAVGRAEQALTAARRALASAAVPALSAEACDAFRAFCRAQRMFLEAAYAATGTHHMRGSDAARVLVEHGPPTAAASAAGAMTTLEEIAKSEGVDVLRLGFVGAPASISVDVLRDLSQ